MDDFLIIAAITVVAAFIVYVGAIVAIIKRPKKTVVVKAVRCPVCHRTHIPDVEFGPFCCASCLQTVIRPLVLMDPKKPR